MAIISSNEYLTVEQMKGNAEYIFSKLSANGWSKNAICGMLGNMQTESTINPGLWESRLEGNMKGGFGLVQWTPATNHTNWASARGYEWGDIDGQIAHIQYELDNNEQWISTSAYPMTFKEFSVSTKPADYLALAFIRNYERPLEPNQPIRGTQALYWFSVLEGGVTPPVTGDYRCKTRRLFMHEDSLLGRSFTSLSNTFKLVKTIGDMAIIEDEKKRQFKINKKNLKKV